MLAHPLFPQIRQGLLPVAVEDDEDLLPCLVCNRFTSLSKLLQFPLRLGFPVGRIKDSRHLSNDVAEARYQTFVRACSCYNGLLCFNRYMCWFLEKAPTPWPDLFGQRHAILILLFFTTRLDLSARR